MELYRLGDYYFLMDIAVIIGAFSVFVAASVGLCAYLWNLSGRITTLSERVVKLETIWDLKLADVGKDIISKDESISKVIQEEK